MKLVNAETLAAALHECYCHQNLRMHSASDHSAAAILAAIPASDPEYVYDPSCPHCRDGSPHHPAIPPDPRLAALVADFGDAAADAHGFAYLWQEGGARVTTRHAKDYGDCEHPTCVARRDALAAFEEKV